MQRDRQKKMTVANYEVLVQLYLELCFSNLFDHGSHLVLKYTDRTQEGSVK
jgi:hypothetical protein